MEQLKHELDKTLTISEQTWIQTSIRADLWIVLKHALLNSLEEYNRLIRAAWVDESKQVLCHKVRKCQVPVNNPQEIGLKAQPSLSRSKYSMKVLYLYQRYDFKRNLKINVSKSLKLSTLFKSNHNIEFYTSLSISKMHWEDISMVFILDYQECTRILLWDEWFINWCCTQNTKPRHSKCINAYTK